MPKYSYLAKSEAGQTIEGDIDAKDELELAKAIRQDGLFLVSAKIQAEEKKKGEISFSFSFGVPLAEKIFFIRNLRLMTSAGISLPRAIANLASQTKNSLLKNALKKIEEKVIRGESLSNSMKASSEIFSELFQNMVKIGEESGTLEEVLLNLASQLEKEAELKSRITGALIYPAVVVSAMIGIGFLMLIVIVPQLAETFIELNLELPLTTQFVVWLGTFSKKFWYLFPVGLLAATALIKRISKTKTGKKFFDKILLRMPVVSGFIKETTSASFSRTLSSLTASGIPLVKSLEIISGTMSNIYFKESLLSAIEKVQKGTKLSDALKPYDNLYLPIVIQMIQVGEETGETSQVLQQLAGFLEEEVANATKNLASLIEPLLMLVVGAAVGFFAISMIQPMYSMLEAI